MSQSLNPQQQQAINHHGGPLLIIAGAGAGKTMVLTHKIAHLVDQHGVSPDQILAITFTSKAAKEMKIRAQKRLSVARTRPLIGTFHFLCAHLLRQYFHRLGWSNQFVIADMGDQLRLIKQL